MVADVELLDEIFSALGHPVRRQILMYLARHGEATVTEIAAPFLEKMSLNAVSKHMKVLEKAELIQREIRGREHYCKINPKTLDDAAAWLEHYRRFWTENLDALEKHLRDKKER